MNKRLEDDKNLVLKAIKSSTFVSFDDLKNAREALERIAIAADGAYEAEDATNKHSQYVQERIAAGAVTLGMLIERLKKADQSLILPRGFDTPHSYRGYYEQLAFEPAKNISVADMLQCAKEADGSTYGGYKGGEYYMDKNSFVWISVYGSSTDKIFTMSILEELLAAGVHRSLI